MNKEEYVKLLKDPRWKVKRLEILERDGYRCTKCGGDYRLSVHHEIYDDINPWEYKNEDLKTLCMNCHKEHHKYNKNVYTNYNLIYKEKFDYDDNGKEAIIETLNKVTTTKQLLESIRLSIAPKENNFIGIIKPLIEDIVTFHDTYNNARINIYSQLTGAIEGYINISIVYNKPKPVSTKRNKSSKHDPTEIWDFKNNCVKKDVLKEIRKRNKLLNLQHNGNT